MTVRHIHSGLVELGAQTRINRQGDVVGDGCAVRSVAGYSGLPGPHDAMRQSHHNAPRQAAHQQTQGRLQ